MLYEQAPRGCYARWLLVAVLGWGIVLSTGCYDPKSVDKFLQEPRRPVSVVEYRVYPPDTLLIDSENIEEFRQDDAGRRGLVILVKPDGKINVPLMGEIFVAGKSLKEIEKDILRAASEYYSEASVNVDVIGYNSQRYYIFGHVANPGPRPWTGHDSLLNALGSAQPTDSAWKERILVIRGDSPQEGGRQRDSSWQYITAGYTPERKGRPQKQLVVNLYAMMQYGDLSNNILLMPNDVIYVQPNPFARVGIAIQQVLFPFQQAAGGLTTYRTMKSDWDVIRGKSEDNSAYLIGGN
jgi:polysaccharide biosynthesis/export protein